MVLKFITVERHFFVSVSYIHCGASKYPVSKASRPRKLSTARRPEGPYALKRGSPPARKLLSGLSKALYICERLLLLVLLPVRGPLDTGIEAAERALRDDAGPPAYVAARPGTETLLATLPGGSEPPSPRPIVFAFDLAIMIER